MKIRTMLSCGAIACCLSAGAAMAQDGPPEAGPPPGMPPLPPGLLAQINLGRAGLLASFYSHEQWGTTQGRIGQSRSTIAAASAPGGPTSGFEDGSTDPVVSLSVQKALPDGKSYLCVKGTLALPNGRVNLIEQDGDNPSLFINYMTFPNPDTMLSFGVFTEQLDIDEAGSGSEVRDGYGIRADVLRKFNDNWVALARAEYSWGESDIRVPAIGFRHVQDDDRFYAQAELIGTFDRDHIAALPEGWVLRPVLGG
ncbi:hypothetical protein [uncultured Roseovarius sp.]|uniref:hypothetical protein n=1 Tax=uncultured Roseovarius sp. TaxID=293344 RepID=UPI002609CDA4|nr:hypothetical protein [uncultured Roseovarius sp.]